MPTEQQLQTWDKAFGRIERVNDYCNLKKLHTSVISQIEYLKESITLFKKPKNPREYMEQVHDKIKCKMLVKQQTRLEDKMKHLQSKIQEDYEEFKKE